MCGADRSFRVRNTIALHANVPSGQLCNTDLLHELLCSNRERISLFAAEMLQEFHVIGITATTTVFEVCRLANRHVIAKYAEYSHTTQADAAELLGLKDFS